MTGIRLTASAFIDAPGTERLTLADVPEPPPDAERKNDMSDIIIDYDLILNFS
jgi:hypothetical protein